MCVSIEEMPSGQHRVMGLLRALGSPAVKKIVQVGLDAALPGLGSVLLSGSSLLGNFIPGIESTLLHYGSEALKSLPSAAEKLIEYALEQPNATVVPDAVAYDAPGLFPGNAQLADQGAGLVMFGHDQPRMANPRPEIKVEYKKRGLMGKQFRDELPGTGADGTRPVKRVVRGSLENTFSNDNTYIPQEGKDSKAPADASTAGYYFREVGPGTNEGTDALGYGETRPAVMKKKRKVRLPESVAPAEKKGKKKSSRGR